MTTEEIRKADSSVGFEFEFLREKTFDIEEVKKSLESLFNIEIHIEDEHHSAFVPTETEWKLEPDYSGGVFLVEMVTGPLPYAKARVVLLQVLKWMRDTNGIYLTSKCGLHINVNVKGRYIQNIDILKYILHFNEELVYKYFPDRADNIYAKSIKSIYPRHPEADIEHLILNKTNYVYPSNKYYGVNFTKLSKGYLEFRYLGGEKYAERADQAVILMDYFIDSLIDCYNSKYTDNDLKELKNIVNKKYKLFLACRSYFNFKQVFKNIRLLVDAKAEEQIIKSYFHKIVQGLFPIFQRMEKIDYDMKGTINYDSDESILEVANIDIKETVIDSLSLVIYDSKLTECVIDNSSLIRCDVTKSDLCNVDTDSCNLKSTRIKEGYHKDGEITDGYIAGKFIVLDRFNVKGYTIFREGKYRYTVIDKSVEIIDAKEIEDENEN